MAAMSSTIATLACKEMMPPSLLKTCLKNNTRISSTNSVKFPIRKAHKRFNQIIRSSSSSSTSSETATEEEAEEEEEEEWKDGSPAEVAKGSPSIISALNVHKALRGIAITGVDHYGRLGLRIGCSYDQVRVAYRNKVNELSNQGMDEEELNTKLELLKESYTILSSEEERRLYDWSLARNENPERYTWPFEADITQTPKGGTPPSQEPEDVGPTRLVGYFLLGWLVLAFTLSIFLNR